jgi:membrane-bound lytic murein transglycosylase A
MLAAGRPLSPAGLPGWDGDDHDAALSAYALTADRLPPGWPRPDGTAARSFFEARFVLGQLSPMPGLVTGYYEPELAGALQPDGRFCAPIHALPPMDRDPWFTRAEIIAGDLLREHELVWLESPLEAFLAQVQGSLRVRLPDGAVLRFGFAGRNGHPYRSIGAELIARGAIPEADMSALAIRHWCAAHPDQVPALLAVNPSYVFFRPFELDCASGPIGALGTPLVAGRSVAVDLRLIPGGAPVWLSAQRLTRLTIAQDQGSAIIGPRIDLFCGSGTEAGETAGRMRISAGIVTFRPRSRS